MLGNGRLEAYCFDGVTRLCHIRGKLRKKVGYFGHVIDGAVQIKPHKLFLIPVHIKVYLLVLCQHFYQQVSYDKTLLQFRQLR